MRLNNGELRDLLAASAVLVFVFSYPDFLVNPSLLFASAIAIVSGFALHELAHKFTANKFGASAEFRLWREGLMMAVVLAIATNGSFVFAAPGAVMISGFRFGFHGITHLNKKEMGVIGAAGPVTNILLAALFAALYSATANPIMAYAARINTSLAIFNMMPIPPLDGSKVMNWGPANWAVIIGAALAFRILFL